MQWSWPLDSIRYFCKNVWNANIQTFPFNIVFVFSEKCCLWKRQFHHISHDHDSYIFATSWGKAGQCKGRCDLNPRVCDFECVRAHRPEVKWRFFFSVHPFFFFFCGWKLNESYTYKKYKTCWRSDLETSDIIFSPAHKKCHRTCHHKNKVGLEMELHSDIYWRLEWLFLFKTTCFLIADRPHILMLMLYQLPYCIL